MASRSFKADFACHSATKQSRLIAQSADAISSLGDAKSAYVEMRMNVLGMVVAATNSNGSGELRGGYIAEQKSMDIKADQAIAG